MNECFVYFNFISAGLLRNSLNSQQSVLSKRWHVFLDLSSALFGSKSLKLFSTFILILDHSSGGKFKRN